VGGNLMVGMVKPYSYDYFPNWEDGVSLKKFATRLLSDYLKDYRIRGGKWK
jgi:hypothetical protein